MKDRLLKELTIVIVASTICGILLTRWNVLNLHLLTEDERFLPTPSQQWIRSSSNHTSPQKSTETDPMNPWNDTFLTTPPHTCAPWLTNRTVLFVELQTWNNYYHPDNPFKTGEYYMSACWEYALTHLNMTVHRVSTRQYYEELPLDELLTYHLIFVRDPKWHRYYQYHDLLCKVRPMYYFGEWYKDKTTDNPLYASKFDEKQVVVAHPEDTNTFLGYFPHNLLQTTQSKPPIGKVGLLYGKICSYFQSYGTVIDSLLNHGFELHATCQDEDEEAIMESLILPKQVVRHHNLGPQEYANLMHQFAFMIGFGKPVGSPSPLIGLSYGVAFLNPLRSNSQSYTQHKALSRLGMPYVYNVNLTNVTSVVQAAEWAWEYPFESYVPPEFRVHSLMDRMCALLEDEALCMCPNPIFGDKDMDWRVDNSTGQVIDEAMDCRASTYTRKASMYPTQH